MSKYIIDHKTKMIHLSSFVCDECEIPDYISDDREDCVDEQHVLSLHKHTYELCSYCYELSPSNSKHEIETIVT